MNILFLLIPLAVIVMGIAISALVWAIKSGQFDDLEGPAHRILMDDEDPRIPGQDGRNGQNGQKEQNGLQGKNR